MNAINKEQARIMFENVVAIRNASPHPFTAEQEKTFREHCFAVAGIAESIAEITPELKPEKAYVMGLLHDCGRIKDERAENVFHGLVGYNYMQEKGYPELARISISHCFYQKDFDINNYPQSKQDLLTCQEILKTVNYNDYDKLLQLADMINDMGKTCTLEHRLESISQRYNAPFQKLSKELDALNNIKAYFDNKCNCDIYKELGVCNDKSSLPLSCRSPKNMGRGS